jgi:endonuclease/exonuclease/phosphatase family metal-dependent hydrolase
MKFRIITYNMHKGIGGVDRRYLPQRIITILKNYDADIVFLQEVDDFIDRLTLLVMHC